MSVIPLHHSSFDDSLVTSISQLSAWIAMEHHLPFLGPSPFWRTILCYKTCAQLTHYSSFHLCILTNLLSIATSDQLSYLTSLSLLFALPLQRFDRSIWFFLDEINARPQKLTFVSVSSCANADVKSAMKLNNSSPICPFQASSLLIRHLARLCIASPLLPL